MKKQFLYLMLVSVIVFVAGFALDYNTETSAQALIYGAPVLFLVALALAPKTRLAFDLIGSLFAIISLLLFLIVPELAAWESVGPSWLIYLYPLPFVLVTIYLFRRGRSIKAESVDTHPGKPHGPMINR